MTPSDLQLLVSHPERPSRSVLSVYLNVDQSERSNQNRGFEKHLKKMTSSIRNTIHDALELERFAAAAHHIEDFVAAYEPDRRGLAMFFDSLDGFFWHDEFDVPLHSQTRWERDMFLQPLANLLDQLEGYGVVLVDRTRFRLFTVLLGEIEEFLREEADPIGDIRRLTKDVDRLIQTKKVHELILAGAPEITSKLRGLLPKSLALRVPGAANIAIDATAREVLEATLAIAEEYECNAEIQKVKEAVRGISGDKATVVGLDDSLNAINTDQVWELIYSEGLTSPGFECAKCGALFCRAVAACSRCRATVHAVGNVVERAVERALRKRARIEIVTGAAADSLRALAGGIGGFLKTKSPRVRLEAS